MTLLLIRVLSVFAGLVVCDLLHRHLTGQRQSFLWRSIWILAVLCICLLVWLQAVKDSQLRPHLVTTTLGNKVLTSQMVTNPAYITYSTAMRLGTNGVEYYQKPQTNYYWTVWPMFAK